MLWKSLKIKKIGLESNWSGCHTGTGYKCKSKHMRATNIECLVIIKRMKKVVDLKEGDCRSLWREVGVLVGDYRLPGLPVNAEKYGGAQCTNTAKHSAQIHGGGLEKLSSGRVWARAIPVIGGGERAAPDTILIHTYKPPATPGLTNAPRKGWRTYEVPSVGLSHVEAG